MFNPPVWPWAQGMFDAVTKVKADAVMAEVMTNEGVSLTYEQAIDLALIYQRNGHRVLYDMGGDVLVFARSYDDCGFTIHLERPSSGEDSSVFAWDLKGFAA